MKKILKINLTILSVLFFYYILRISINILGITTKNHNLINKLYIININEPYVAYYNNGNIYYKERNYKRAIKEYKKALILNPPNNKICIIKRKLFKSIINNTNNLENINTIKNRLINDKCYDKEIKSYITKNINKIDNKQKIIKSTSDKSNKNRQLDIEKYENLSRYNYSYHKK